MDEREMARYLGTARVAVGAAMFLAPKWSGRVWVGRQADTTGARTVTRGFGGRDAALGLGLLMALEEGKGAGRWLALSAMADAGDVAATLAGWGRLPRFNRLSVLMSAAGFGVLGAWLSTRVD